MNFKKTILIIFLFLLLATFHMYVYTKTMAASYNVENIERQLNKVRSENRYLESRLAREQSLDKIEKIARNTLGMGEPQVIKFITSEAAPR